MTHLPDQPANPATDAERSPRVSEIASYRTGRHCLIRIYAEGVWSAIDIEGLYEHLGHGLRVGAFDAAMPLTQEPRT